MLGMTGNHSSEADDAKSWEQYAGIEGSEINLSTVRWDSHSSESDEEFVFHLNDLVPPDFLRSDTVLRNIWQFGGDRVELEANSVPWLSHLPSRHFRDRLHRFEWLPDLFAIGAAGSDRARYLVDSWISVFGHFDSFAWRVGPTADRLWNWLRCGTSLFVEGKPEHTKTRLKTFKRQVSYLKATIEQTYCAQARWKSACVLMAYRLCLQTSEDLRLSMSRLEQECNSQFLWDGCHASRAPSASCGAFLDLAILTDLFQQADRPVPRFITELQTKLIKSISFFRQGDDGIASFNGGNEVSPDHTEAISRLIRTWPEPQTVLKKSGFCRLERGETILLMDTGDSPQPRFGHLAHAGTFGIEISVGSSRVITSHGHSLDVTPALQSKVRRTSAHSTLTMGENDTTEFIQCPDSKFFVPDLLPDVQSSYFEDEGSVWINAQHAGYHEKFYLTHHRRLYMNADGTQIRGEDSVARPISGGVKDSRQKIPFVIRFHIHPSTSVTKKLDYLLLEPSVGSPWVFRTSNNNVHIESSLYIGRDAVEDSEQVVIYGQADSAGIGSKPPNCVRWMFRKE